MFISFKNLFSKESSLSSFNSFIKDSNENKVVFLSKKLIKIYPSI